MQEETGVQMRKFQESRSGKGDFKKEEGVKDITGEKCKKEES
jgi:hypothetical protein